MKQFSGFIVGLSQQLDKMAAFFITGVMVLVVSNIILRSVFNWSIPGTYELVGFLTAVAIGLALANCAVKNAHIGVDFLIERLPLKIQTILDSMTNFTAFIFWGLSAWHLQEYASSMTKNGVVLSTSQIPIYPFIYIIAIGLLSLCLVLFLKWADLTKKAFAATSFTKFLLQDKLLDYARKEMR